MGPFRAAGPKLSGRSPSPGCDGAGRGRAGIGHWLGPVRRSYRRNHRHAHLRLVRYAERFADEVRIYAGKDYGSRESSDCTEWPPMNPLKDLQERGQAMWLDFLARGFIAKGD